MLKISIVIPNFNSGDTLERAIHSLIDQDYPHKQLILVDGGSVDGSIPIIDKHRGHFDTVISERDRGQADALNKGFSQADGDIFGWLCADDELLPGAMRHVAALFENDPEAEVLTGRCERIYPDGSTYISPARSDAWEVINVQDVIEQPSTFWRSSFHRRLGELDVSYRMAFDWDLWVRMRNMNARLITTDRILSRYFFTKSNKSGNAGNEFAEEAFRIIRKYGPLHGGLAYIFRFLYYHFDLKGAFVYPPSSSRFRWTLFRWTWCFLRFVIGQRLLYLYNWHFAACQEQGLEWWHQ
jgi:glycosyltransferase involved in cell wall biosynthesis